MLQMIQWLFVENSPSLFTVRRRVALVFGLVPIVCVVLLAAARISLPIRCLRLTGFLPASEDRMPAVEGCASATCGPGKMKERHVCTDHYSIWGWQVCVLHQRTGFLLWKVCASATCGPGKMKERHVCTDHCSIWGWQVCVLHQRTGCLLWKVAPLLLVGLEKSKRDMYVQTTTQYKADRFASCTRGEDACCGRLRLCYLWAWKNAREACMYRPLLNMRLTGLRPAPENRMPAVEGCASATCGPGKMKERHVWKIAREACMYSGPGKMKERHVCTDHYSIWGWQVCVLHQRTGCLLWKVAPLLLVGLEKWKRGMYVQTTTQYEADRFASCTREQDACCGRLRLCYLWAWKNERETCMYRPLLNMRLTGLCPAPENRMPAVEGCASATCGPGKMKERHVCTDHYSIWGWQVCVLHQRTGCLLWKVAPLLLVGLEKWKRDMYVQTTYQCV